VVAVARMGAARHAPMMPLQKAVPMSLRHPSRKFASVVTTEVGVTEGSGVAAAEVTSLPRPIPTVSHQTPAPGSDSTENRCQWEYHEK
jgi:hypothetical protein